MSSEYFKAKEILAGYSYPASYHDFINSNDLDSLNPWWFIGSSEGLFDISFNLLNKDLESNCELIPFAKSEETKASEYPKNRSNGNTRFRAGFAYIIFT